MLMTPESTHVVTLVAVCVSIAANRIVPRDHTRVCAAATNSVHAVVPLATQATVIGVGALKR